MEFSRKVGTTPFSRTEESKNVWHPMGKAARDAGVLAAMAGLPEIIYKKNILLRMSSTQISSLHLKNCTNFLKKVVFSFNLATCVQPQTIAWFWLKTDVKESLTKASLSIMYTVICLAHEPIRQSKERGSSLYLFFALKVASKYWFIFQDFRT